MISAQSKWPGHQPTLKLRKAIADRDLLAADLEKKLDDQRQLFSALEGWADKGFLGRLFSAPNLAVPSGSDENENEDGSPGSDQGAAVHYGS